MSGGVPASLLRDLLDADAAGAWAVLRHHLSDRFAASPPPATTLVAAQAHDRALAPLDLVLASAAWNLWRSYEESVPRTADELVRWWAGRGPGRAALVLDGLSLREMPLVLSQAALRGWAVHRSDVTGAEIPPDTTSFARALGFPQRSALERGRTGASHRLPQARTECSGLPWGDCSALVDSSPDVLFWHHWPDDRVHVLGAPGAGLAELAGEAARELASDDLWAFLDRLATGRRLVITSDHGYAASGLFPDVHDAEQISYLQDALGGSRLVAAGESWTPRWAPPLDLRLESKHGAHRLALGRRKWKCRGGHPTLAHGGLTLLEVLVPFIELSRPGGV